MKRNKLDKIQLSEIMYFSKCGVYTLALLKGDKQEIIEHSLENLELMLPDKTFFRIHRGFLVNLEEIEEILPGRSPNKVILSDGSKLPVSKRKRRALIAQIDPV
ncbi:MAG TPA: LytTR family DNA-binding domain-containing protein [Bacteroidales bacterium]|nr:LytTR family DNA-binding domain-containing protein [Balneolales bacterium]HYX09800.1 LytTR family DNA-binding domain-containing protein [Bacteroidales bacterium]